ncbi:baseplate assembly protein [Halodesulfovibrio aestuarii]|uniref:baseplate assembly protein n=1 Tax=Halodesulfovibrio aestuarii TaxID=126333 RepID=UPI00035DC82B|nr:baseplate J/gp47 family protein [Halodesulfovibrio aestuarii]
MSLPDLTFVDNDPAKIEARMIANFEAITGTKLYPGAPERLLLESTAMEFALIRSEFDHSAKQNLATYAEDEHLDHVSAFVSTKRLDAAYASGPFEFTAEAEHTGIVVPKGSQITPDGKLMFATTEDAGLVAGKTTVTVKAVCETAGSIANGFAAGQINKLVKPIAGIVSVQNTATSMGGANVESNDHLRERALKAPRGFSTAGPVGAYGWWAMSAHQEIAHAVSVSPQPCEIEVYVLMEKGRIPTTEELAQVAAVLSPDKVRPQGDRVQVLAPAQIEYTLNITWYAPSVPKQAALAAEVERIVAEFTQWQRLRLGRDINPSELIHRLRSAGVQNVNVALPAYAAVASTQVAVCTDTTINFGGVQA